VDQDSLSKFLLAAGSLRYGTSKYFEFYSISNISIVADPDPGSEILGFFGPGIRDGKKYLRIRDEHPGSYRTPRV
jgi:hypothetical protein